MCADVHELAHEMLHKAERRTTTTKVVRETEAEAIAFVIGKAVGLETGSASADYIQLYHGNASFGRELGSHPADLRRHPCRLAAAHRSRGRDARCRTGEGGLMQTFAVYAGAVICFGGLIFAGIRMMSGRFQYLAIDTIHESTTNPRRTFDEGKLRELAESIKHNGLIQPITVRPNNEGFEIVAGASASVPLRLRNFFPFPPESSRSTTHRRSNGS